MPLHDFINSLILVFGCSLSAFCYWLFISSNLSEQWQGLRDETLSAMAKAIFNVKKTIKSGLVHIAIYSTLFYVGWTDVIKTTVLMYILFYTIVFAGLYYSKQRQKGKA